MSKFVHTFKKSDDGKFGKAFEIEIKRALKRRNAVTVSPCGMSDFRYNNKNYDAKQNGTVIKYQSHSQYVRGSSRVIYATHISYEIIGSHFAPDKDGTMCEWLDFTVDLYDTQMFVLDKVEFIEFLLEHNKVKINKSRGCANIQSGYIYKSNKFHGATSRLIEEWAFEHEIDDDVIGDILEGLE